METGDQEPTSQSVRMAEAAALLLAAAQQQAETPEQLDDARTRFHDVLQGSDAAEMVEAGVPEETEHGQKEEEKRKKKMEEERNIQELLELKVIPDKLAKVLSPEGQRKMIMTILRRDKIVSSSRKDTRSVSEKGVEYYRHLLRP